MEGCIGEKQLDALCIYLELPTLIELIVRCDEDSNAVLEYRPRVRVTLGELMAYLGTGSYLLRKAHSHSGVYHGLAQVLHPRPHPMNQSPIASEVCHLEMDRTSTT